MIYLKDVLGESTNPTWMYYDWLLLCIEYIDLAGINSFISIYN